MSAIPPGFRIDRAVESDVPLLLALIRELAEFEKLEHEVEASEADLRRALFGARRYAEVVIARVGAEPAGFALFFHNFSTFVGKPGIYLEDLYVKLAWRGKGCGAALLQYVAKEAVTRGCGRFEWAVLDWNQRAIDFYQKLGAKPLNDWTTFRVTGESLRKLSGN